MSFTTVPPSTFNDKTIFDRYVTTSFLQEAIYIRLVPALGISRCREFP